MICGKRNDQNQIRIYQFIYPFFSFAKQPHRREADSSSTMPGSSASAPATPEKPEVHLPAPVTPDPVKSVPVPEAKHDKETDTHAVKDTSFSGLDSFGLVPKLVFLGACAAVIGIWWRMRSGIGQAKYHPV